MERTARRVLELEHAPACEVSLFLTDDQGIQALNLMYRDLDQPTDVLSFPLDQDGMPTLPDVPTLLGDIVLSVERARDQADEYGHSFERELAFLVVHGVLHLLGYDHEEEDERRAMRSREETILFDLGLRRA